MEGSQLPQKAHLVLYDGQVRHLCDGIPTFHIELGVGRKVYVPILYGFVGE
jgi:hypothetical protein